MAKIVYLTNNIDFTNCIKNGSKLSTNSLLIFYKKSSFNISRIGISISKKVSKLAVERNYIKRQIKSFFYMSYIIFKNSLDVVIIVKNNFLKNDYWTNLNDFKFKINEKKLINVSRINLNNNENKQE